MGSTFLPYFLHSNPFFSTLRFTILHSPPPSCRRGAAAQPLHLLSDCRTASASISSRTGGEFPLRSVAGGEFCSSEILPAYSFVKKTSLVCSFQGGKPSRLAFVCCSHEEGLLKSFPLLLLMPRRKAPLLTSFYARGIARLFQRLPRRSPPLSK